MGNLVGGYIGLRKAGGAMWNMLPPEHLGHKEITRHF